ncbi:MAG: hypothetical protein U0174_20725 [Polyangiaceae bacterium]
MMMGPRFPLALTTAAMALTLTSGALAADPPMGAPQPAPPTTSAPSAPAAGGSPAPKAGATANDPNAAPQGGDDGAAASPPPRAEPTAAPPPDPLFVSESIQKRIGSDYDGRPPAAVGELQRSYFPYYEERRGDYRLRFLPPLFLQHTRNADTDKADTQGLYGFFYYNRRSPKIDADVVFPLAYRVRDGESHMFGFGPWMHREAPKENDNWLAPLYFQGARADGGYFHAPLLLTTSSWNTHRAFTLVGPYFRDRTDSDLDWGVAPFFFHGNNGNNDGARKSYTLIPPLLYYNRTKELEETSFTMVGPLVLDRTPKRSIVDVVPFFFHIEGRPDNGGVKESHTTVFPLFHYGTSPKQDLFYIPGYLRRTTPTSDTMLTPLVSIAKTRYGSSRLFAAGPILPLFMDKNEKDTGLHWTALWPLFFRSESPKGFGYATPLFAYFKNYGESKDLWLFPNITWGTDTKGWEFDIHPLVYTGTEEKHHHTVVAPLYWDFGSDKSRGTVAFPFYWRFGSQETGTVTQVALNTLYRERKVRGGTDWDFHLLPLFSYGHEPEGHFWNVLFGLVGYSTHAKGSELRALWIPITLSSNSDPTRAATR